MVAVLGHSPPSEELSRANLAVPLGQDHLAVTPVDKRIRQVDRHEKVQSLPKALSVKNALGSLRCRYCL